MNSLKYGSKSFVFIMIPLVIAVYLCVLFWQIGVERTRGEIFPFFSWSLFSSPSNYIVKSYLEVESVDGVSVDENTGLISVGDTSIRLQKAIKEVLDKCRGKSVASCEDTALKVLSPYVRWGSAYSKLRFSVSRCFVDREKFIASVARGMVVFPKFIECRTKEKFGPWSIIK